ncbi:MAG: type II secretion system minor pseudopilin GspI [Burkholderiaceae bacterium]
MNKSRTLTYGFTLIEVLVALGIVSIALLAGMRATDSLVNNAQRLSDVLLGQVCVENELIKVRLSKAMPNVGDSTFSCEQAGKTMLGKMTVSATPNPSFRRVDTEVFQGEKLDTGATSVIKLSTIVGRF